MRTDLPVLSYAVAGCTDIPFPDYRRSALPPPGPRGRRARLPTLAVDLARRAAGDRELPETTAIEFGTALGCMTETEAFLENMIRAHEAEPKPRAFSSSVHNALASRVSIALGAKGECRTFTHGEISFLQACLAAGHRWAGGGREPALVGALDETTPYVERGRVACHPGETREPAEGGAVFLCGEGRGEEALACVRSVAYARPRRPGEWLTRKLEGMPLDAALVDLRGPDTPRKEILRALGTETLASRRWTGDHPSACASASALGVALLAGEVAPAAVGLQDRPHTLAVLAGSRLADLGLLILERLP
ncbi:MAG: beta-ketoacyl synthase chain length factor [Planctomycetota bacterium]|jgi:hypothetical protein